MTEFTGPAIVCKQCVKSGSQKRRGGTLVPGTTEDRFLAGDPKEFDRAAYNRAASRAKNRLAGEFRDRYRELLNEELQR